MPKQIVANSIETLGQSAKQSGKQVVQIPFKIVEKAGEQIGVTTGAQKGSPEVPSEIAKGQNETAKIAEKQTTQRRLNYLEEELRVIKAKKKRETTVQNIQEENQKKEIRQLEVEKKKEIPQMENAKRKGGTGERRKRGGDA